jgi:hypothetical protein
VPSIVGTWKLVRAVARDGSGATLPEPYRGKGIGRVTFNGAAVRPKRAMIAPIGPRNFDPT